MVRPAARPVVPSLDVLIVINPIAAHTESGEARKWIDAALESRGSRARILETPSADDAANVVAGAIQLALDAGCNRVVSVGGDGTAALVATALMQHRGNPARPLLAIVPTGTANVLARELGIPLALEDAITLALDGDDSMELDAIQTVTRPVFTQVGIGMDARMIQQTSREARVRSGRLAYIFSLLRESLGQRAYDFELEIEGRVLRLRAWQIVVANVGAMGSPPFTWGPGIDPSDGYLDVCIYSARTTMDHLTIILRLLTGRHQVDSRTQYLRTKHQIVIRSRRPVLVQGDGEILGRTPITLEVDPLALRVCVPKEVEPSEPIESIHQAVDTMVAQRSRTWLLQGWPRHPYTFFSALDAALYMRVNALQLGSVSERGLIFVSRILHHGEAWVFVALVMLSADPRSAWRPVLEGLPVLWLAMLTVNYPLKRVFRRRRPFIAFVDARVLGPKPLDSSFPSGHTAAAFAGAFLFGAHLPLWSPLFYAIAALVGFSRIYLGVHYPSDVAMGALVGVGLAAGYLALLHMVFPI
ncbi:MAG: phosphatase PAP2 family protein [Candidatus Eisenbacteria bacterium]